jgi:glucose-6-phosphate 1-dehydrogenase
MDGRRSVRLPEEKRDPATVDTFAAVKFYIDNWRWQDVPFISAQEKGFMKNNCYQYSVLTSS